MSSLMRTGISLERKLLEGLDRTIEPKGYSGRPEAVLQAREVPPGGTRPAFLCVRPECRPVARITEGAARVLNEQRPKKPGVRFRGRYADKPGQFVKRNFAKILKKAEAARSADNLPAIDDMT